MASTRVTLHDSIRRTLIEEVQDLPLEHRLPSDRDLASRFGVALLTINKVMRSLEADGYVTRVQGKGTMLASREQRVRRHGPKDRATFIVAAPNYFSHDYWLRGYMAEERALKSGGRVVEFRFGGEISVEGLLRVAARESHLTGVLISPVPGTLTREAVEQLDALGVPVVIFFPCEWLSFCSNVHAIVPDQFQLGYLATQQLIRGGYQSLAYLNNEPPHFDDGQLRTGVKQALYDSGLRLRDLLRPAPACKVWGDSRDAGYRMTKEALAAGADGLLFASVYGAVGGYRAIQEAGLSVPGDVGVVAAGGFDNLETYLSPPLTTVTASTKWEMDTAFDLIRNAGDATSRLILSEVEVHDRSSVRALDAEPESGPEVVDASR